MNSIQEQWSLFERTVVPRNASAVQRSAMKLGSMARGSGLPQALIDAIAPVKFGGPAS